MRALQAAGCQPGDLRLVLLTHGDFDHTGNGAYLREGHGVQVAMHPGDAGMVERGDMFWNRKSGGKLLRAVAPLLFGFGKSRRFKPDLYVEEGYDLSTHGLAARALHLPGHSAGSIGILTAAGDLFCGDLLENVDRPRLNGIIDDPVAATASVERLKSLGIRTVYPGHGAPFTMAQYVERNR